MTDTEEKKPNLKKSSYLPIKLIIFVGISFLLGLSVGLFIGRKWLIQLLPPIIQHTTQNEYDSLQECPSLEADGVDIQSISWKANNNKCTYNYKVKTE